VSSARPGGALLRPAAQASRQEQRQERRKHRTKSDKHRKAPRQEHGRRGHEDLILRGSDSPRGRARVLQDSSSFTVFGENGRESEAPSQAVDRGRDGGGGGGSLLPAVGRLQVPNHYRRRGDGVHGPGEPGGGGGGTGTRGGGECLGELGPQDLTSYTKPGLVQLLFSPLRKQSDSLNPSEPPPSISN